MESSIGLEEVGMTMVPGLGNFYILYINLKNEIYNLSVGLTMLLMILDVGLQMTPSCMKILSHMMVMKEE